jgi:hypothetical protein
MSDLCPHESITIDQEHNRFTCVWCKEPVVMRTKAGQIITACRAGMGSARPNSTG